LWLIALKIKSNFVLITKYFSLKTIAVNTRLLIPDKLEGIGWFAYETLKRICVQHREIKFIFIFDRPFSDEFIFSDNIEPVVVGPKARHPVLFYWWFEQRLPGVLKKINADLFFSPDGYLSLSTTVPSHAVIHDLNFEHYPENLPYIIQKYYRHYFPRFAKKASRIATVSEFSKNDIVKTYGIQEQKIDVVYNGAGNIFKPVSKDEKRKIQEKFSGGSSYFLFVGSVNPRKNIINLLKAFDQYKKAKSANTKLLIAGEKKWWSAAAEKTFADMDFRNDVIFSGRLKNEELAQVMAAAEALTYISFFEGFGIPILEAMNCDVPVITSGCSSMPEIAGDAALLVDPFSVEQIKDAMVEITGNSSLKETLIKKARLQREKFSWDRTASLLWNSMEKSLNN
jgi:glycosyltransferase involved in cell wall biosynthesis